MQCAAGDCVACCWKCADGDCVAYGVALVSRIDKIKGLFCKRALQKRQYSAIETYNLIDLTDRSHPIVHERST